MAKLLQGTTILPVKKNSWKCLNYLGIFLLPFSGGVATKLQKLQIGNSSHRLAEKAYLETVALYKW